MSAELDRIRDLAETDQIRAAESELIALMEKEALAACTCLSPPRLPLVILDHTRGCEYRNDRTARNDPPSAGCRKEGGAA